MSIHVIRVETRDVGGQIFQNSPGNFTFDLVIEASADVGDAANIYTPNVVCFDFTIGAPAAAAAAMVPLAGPLTAPNGAGTPWIQPLVGGRFELERSYTVTVPAAAHAGVTDHLFKYFVVLAKAGAPPDADGAESEVFVLH